MHLSLAVTVSFSFPGGLPDLAERWMAYLSATSTAFRSLKAAGFLMLLMAKELDVECSGCLLSISGCLLARDRQDGRTAKKIASASGLKMRGRLLGQHR
jgi:hypothetical protein